MRYYGLGERNRVQCVQIMYKLYRSEMRHLEPRALSTLDTAVKESQKIEI